jgi:hypothetical protein
MPPKARAPECDTVSDEQVQAPDQGELVDLGGHNKNRRVVVEGSPMTLTESA